MKPEPPSPPPTPLQAALEARDEIDRELGRLVALKGGIERKIDETKHRLNGADAILKVLESYSK